MDKLTKIINTCKRLGNLPYNSFNLDNYFPILYKTFGELGFKNTDKNQPIKLMSGNHENSGIITYNQLISPYRKRNIYIIGKGILFDSGGYDLKGKDMYAMTDDKLGALIALSVANYLKENVIAYCPVTTNFLHTSKIIPGDEIKIGKRKVKIIDTDAEGRLILAEALSTLPQTKNDIIITVATLTGAVQYAIGTKATGVFGDDLVRPYAIASRKANELAWGLPLWDYIDEQYKEEKILKNSHKGVKCGATEAALFLKQFIKYPKNWVHLDIASSAFDDKGKANGVPIKSLINFINLINKK
jgi:leucyl aminopeptidase